MPDFIDGFGARWLAFDHDESDPVEILGFDKALVDTPGFATELGVRVARLAGARHTFYARVRRVDRPSTDSLHLVSDHIPGWRLSQVLDTAAREGLKLDISAVLGLLRQLIPAIALFARHQKDLAIGTIAAERLILTPQGRLVVAEYVLGPAVEKLQLSRERLWRDFRVAIPSGAGGSRITPKCDVAGVGVVTLSLLLGRLLTSDEYPNAIPSLLPQIQEWSGGSVRPMSEGLGTWLGRTFNVDGRSGFHTLQEAQVAFEEVLARERGYVTTPAILETFVARFQSMVGPPPMPVPPAPPAEEVAPAVLSRAVEHAPEPEQELEPQPEPETEPEPEPEPMREPEPVRQPEPPRIAPIASAQPEPEPPPPVSPRVEIPPPPDKRPGSGILAPEAVAPEPAVTASSSAQASRRWMVGALAVFSVLVVIEAIAIVWLWNRDSGSSLSGEGELVVQSRPVAARVVIDGEERGATPLTVRLSPGTHILEVRAGRSEPRVIPLQIRAGVQTAQYVELLSVPTSGGLEVRTEPGRARVTIDGQYRGETPLTIKDLPPGDHEVVLRAGDRVITQTVRVEPGVTAQLVVPLR